MYFSQSYFLFNRILSFFVTIEPKILIKQRDLIKPSEFEKFNIFKNLISLYN